VSLKIIHNTNNVPFIPRKKIPSPKGYLMASTHFDFFFWSSTHFDFKSNEFKLKGR